MPSGAILWESAVLLMASRIWVENMSLALHICWLSEDSLTRKVWEEQLVYGWPGLAAEAKHIASELGVAGPGD